MEEVTGPVIAIVLVLSAVFVPVAFLGGMTGQLYGKTVRHHHCDFGGAFPAWWH
ncbi:MAG: efflux RND transporter permease subunit [Candidatus Competibacteraceae bacterium]